MFKEMVIAASFMVCSANLFPNISGENSIADSNKIVEFAQICSEGIYSAVECMQEARNSTEFDSSVSENDINSCAETESKTNVFLTSANNKPVILDVDMSTDVDDVCAIRMATSMDDAGVIDLKGVMFSVTGENNVQALRGLLVHDGKQDVLIGTCSIQEPDVSPYWNTLAEYNDDGGDIDTAVRQYRKILQNSDELVDIVVTGYATNLEYLLESKADDVSPLDGKTLVKEKVGQLYVVGGSYPDGFSNNFHYSAAAREAIDFINYNWGKPIIFSPGQTGGKLVCGKALQEIDSDRKDIVTKALYDFGTENGRTAWDPFGVWLCAYGCSEINQVTLERCNLSTYPESDTSSFIPNENGNHYVVHLCNPDYNYYNVTMDEWLTNKYKSIYEP